MESRTETTDSLSKLNDLCLRLSRCIPNKKARKRALITEPKKASSPYKGIKSYDFFSQISRKRFAKATQISGQRSAHFQNNYRPYDKRFILALLASYASPRWIWTPSFESTLTPLLCVLNGWKCASDGSLFCVSCDARISLVNPMAEEDGVIRELEKQYLSLLSTKHVQGSCSWAKRPASKELAYDLNCLNGDYELESMRLRVEKNRNSTLNFLDIDQEVNSAVCSFIGCSDEKIGAISLLGWELVPGGPQDIYTCNSCLRHFIDEKRPVDLYESHQKWCCFRRYQQLKCIVDIKKGEKVLPSLTQSLKKIGTALS